MQAFDEWVATFNARVVLVDNPDLVRATLTASWLLQMNVAEVVVLPVAPHEATETGPDRGLLAATPPDVPALEAGEAKARMDAGQLTVIDVDASSRYRAGHLPGATFALRSRLMGDVARIPGNGPILLTSADGVLAAFAAAELSAATERPISILRGGTAAWRAAGHPLEQGDGRRMHAMEDAWTSPYAYPTEAERFAAFRTYLGWEIDLIGQIKRDGTTRFRTYPAA